MDTITNSHGIKLLDLCKGTSLRLANGRLHHDKQIGSYTYCNKQGASVIDYLLLSENDLNRIKDFRINEFNEWSDKAPITFEIVCENGKYIKKEKDNTTYTYKWLPENKENFRGSIIGHLPIFNDIVNSMNVLVCLFVWV